jgi:hypothetical protein
VLGPIWLHPSVKAEHGDWAATMTRRVQVGVRKTGRGERSQTSGTDLFVPMTWSLPIQLVGLRLAVDVVR